MHIQTKWILGSIGAALMMIGLSMVTIGIGTQVIHYRALHSAEDTFYSARSSFSSLPGGTHSLGNSDVGTVKHNSGSSSGSSSGSNSGSRSGSSSGSSSYGSSDSRHPP